METSAWKSLCLGLGLAWEKAYAQERVWTAELVDDLDGWKPAQRIVVVRRLEGSETDGEPFSIPMYKYDLWATNLSLTPLELERFYNKQAILENLFGTDKDQLHIKLMSELERLRCRIADLGSARLRQSVTADALRESQEMYTALLNSTTDVALLISAEGEVLSLNQMAALLFGQPVVKLVGRNIVELLPDHRTAEGRRRILEVVRSGCPARFVDIADGVFTESSYRPIFDRNCRAAMLGVFYRDITFQVRAEANLLRAREAAEAADSVKSRLVTSLSHELRTPLNSIIGFSEVLENQFYGDLNRKQLEFIELIRSSGRHLLNLINDILDLAKVESGKSELHLSKVNIKELLKHGLGMIEQEAARHRLALYLHVDGELEDMGILADDLKLKQIVLNLLSNAVKFTPDGGSIRVQAVKEADELTVTVSDSGIGVRPEDQQRIFDRFEQVGSPAIRKQGGSGLGLALSKALVELHGGRISMESEGEGKGSTFRFVIPVVEEGQSAGGSSLVYPEKNAEPAAIDFEAKVENDSARRVLVVEDNPAGMELVSNVLQEGGYAVLQAGTAEDAIRVARGESPALILMDISLPGMDGLTATRILNSDERTRSIPVVALTAHAMNGDEVAAMNAGCDAYLTKPIDRGRFFGTLKSLI